MADAACIGNSTIGDFSPQIGGRFSGVSGFKLSRNVKV